MPIISSVTAVTAKVYGLLSATVVKIQDSFNRTNNASSLGTADTGSVWTNTRGTWGISGNTATTSDAGSTYPLASVVSGKTNNTVSANITNGGPGVAFWVTDANSWWASSVDYSSTSSSTSYSYAGCCGPSVSVASNATCCGGGSPSQNTVYTYYCYYTTYVSSTTYSCSSGTLSGTSCYGSYYDPDLAANVSYYIGPATATTTSTPTCSSWYSTNSYPSGCCSLSITSNTQYTCPSSSGTCTSTITTTTYKTTLKLYSSVSGTVAVQSSLEIGSSTSGYQVADKIETTTANNSITVKGYSGASQLGSALSYTATSPTKGPRVGIIRTPSSENSGSVVDNFLSVSD